MRSEFEIRERIEHLKTLNNGYGIRDKKIYELLWVLEETPRKSKKERTKQKKEKDKENFIL